MISYAFILNWYIAGPTTPPSSPIGAVTFTSGYKIPLNENKYFVINGRQLPTFTFTNLPANRLYTNIVYLLH